MATFILLSCPKWARSLTVAQRVLEPYRRRAVCKRSGEPALLTSLASETGTSEFLKKS